jgi:hypothetical protein
LCANIISNVVAPSSGPKNIPAIPPKIAPTSPPIIAPTIPHPVEPNFLAPSAIAMLSESVERRQRRKSIIRINGVMFSNLSIMARIMVDIYMSQIPGRFMTINTRPVRDIIPRRTYIMMLIISIL